MSTQLRGGDDISEHYSIDNILKEDAEYNILLSERSSGKSYQVKKTVIKDFLESGAKFVYLRRFVIELKESMVNDYFDDENIPYRKWTKNKYDGIMSYRSNLYFYVWEEDKKVRKEQCGKYMALSSSNHYKSMAMTQYKNVIYEEFVAPPSGYGYLQDECNELQQLVSTIARKNRIRVFLIGNTINSMCPYFREWGLKGIPKQKSGTIDVYHMQYSTGEIKIAVEICKETASKGKMFFGNIEKNINNGVWVSEEYPKLPHQYKECSVLYVTIWQWGDLCYKAEILRHDTEVFLYVRPCDINKIFTLDSMRFISDIYKHRMARVRSHTPTFVPINNADKLIEQLVDTGKICFSDNMSGEEFTSIYDIYHNKHKKGVI